MGGQFVFDDEKFTFDPGWIAAVAASWKMVGESRNDAFLLVGFALAASGSVTRDARDTPENMLGIDFRLSITGGKTFYDVLTPYLVVRGFGGPVLWGHRDELRIGGDKYHFQVGGGLVVALPEHFDVFAEGVPIGERSAVLGVGYSF